MKLTCSGVPILVIEIKTPRPEDKEDPVDDIKCQGQLFDYMMDIKHSNGLMHIIGVITTWDTTRFFWFPESEDYVHKDIEPIEQDEYIQDLRPLYDSETFDGSVDTTIHGEANNDHLVRQLYCGSVFKLPDDSVELVKTYATSMVMGLRTDSTVVHMFDRNRFYSTWNFTGDQLSRLPGGFTFKKKKLWIFQPIKLPIFILFKFGEGQDGRVFLAVTSEQPACLVVVKLYFSQVPRESIEREVRIWRNVWSVAEVDSIIVNKRDSTSYGERILWMPYAFQVDKNSASVKQGVRDAASALADAGYEHDDLEWRHVKELRYRGQSQIIFIDLTDVKQIKRKQSRESTERMISRLLDKRRR